MKCPIYLTPQQTPKTFEQISWSQEKRKKMASDLEQQRILNFDRRVSNSVNRSLAKAELVVDLIDLGLRGSNSPKRKLADLDKKIDKLNRCKNQL